MKFIQNSIYFYYVNSKTNPLGLFNSPFFNISFSILLSLIFGGSADRVEFFFYVFSGLTIFNFYSSCISTGLKVNNDTIENFIISRNLKYRDFFFERSISLFIDYLFNFLIFIILFFIFSEITFFYKIIILLKFLAYSILVFFSGVSIIYFFYFFSKISLIFSTLVSLALRMLFFATPIFWKPDNVQGFKSLIVDYNPIACSMMIVRNFFDIYSTNYFQILNYSITFILINGLSFFLFFSFRKFIRNVK